jgi:iron(III) transport system substrate-binding protein
VRRTCFAALAIVAGSLLVYGGPSGAGEPSIVLYNGQHPQLTDKLVAAFTRQTGIPVRVRANDGIVLADQILQEGSASPSDVYLTENSPELMFLEQHGLLARLSPTVLSRVPVGDSSPSGRWVGVGLRVSSLVYNPAVVRSSTLPASILELARPKWQGKVAVAPIDSDFPPLVGAIVAAYGKAAAARWLAGLKHNAHVYQDEEAVVAAVNRGDVAMGIANQYYWYRLRLELGPRAMHSSLSYFSHGDVGSVENVSGAAVLASSHQRNEAQAFVRFLVSPAGQRIIAASDDFEYPARPGIQPNKALPSLTAIDPATVGVRELGNDQEATQLIQQAGLV